MFLGCTFLLLGCTTSQTSLNQTIEVNSVSFKAVAWGFAPEWGAWRPVEGSKVLWIRVVGKNIGGVPQDLPNDFSLKYRNTNAQTPPHEAYEESADLYSACVGCYVYPGVSREGYLLYEVPENLVGGEAALFVNVVGKAYYLQLENPESYLDKKVSVLNATLDCSYGEYAGNNRQYECDYLTLFLGNIRSHVPIHDYYAKLDLVLDGRRIIENHNVEIKLKPKQQVDYKTEVNWKFDRQRNSYFEDVGLLRDYSKEISVPGRYIAEVIIKSSEGVILGNDNVSLVLPSPP